MTPQKNDCPWHVWIKTPEKVHIKWQRCYSSFIFGECFNRLLTQVATYVGTGITPGRGRQAAVQAKVDIRLHFLTPRY